MIKASKEELMITLIDVINQACQVEFKNKTCYIHHSFLSAYEGAFGLLEEEGRIVEDKKGRYKIVKWE